MADETDDASVVELADFRAPPIGDPAYDRALRCQPASVVPMRSTRAKDLLDQALSEGVGLDHIAREIAARQRTCLHRGTVIDNKARTLRCESCGADVDPFDVLYAITNHDLLLYKSIVRRDALHREIQRLQEYVERLKGEEKRTKARAAAAKKAREKALRLSLPEVRELGLFRDLWDAVQAYDRTAAKRLRSQIDTIQQARREAEAKEDAPDG